MSEDLLRNLEDQWLGDKKIKFAEVVGTNPGGVELVKVTYGDGALKLWTRKMLDTPGVVTKHAQDLSEFREKQVVAIVGELLTVLRDYSPKEKDLTYIIGKLEASLVENIKKAQSILWGIENEGEETLADVDNVLLNAQKPA